MVFGIELIRIVRIEHVNVIDGEKILEVEECPYFYNWLTDGALIEEYLAWPLKTILRDVLGESKVWLKSWGAKPDSEEEKKAVFTKWYANAPK